MTEFSIIGPLNKFVSANVDHKNVCEQFEKINSSEKGFLAFASKSLSTQEVSKVNQKGGFDISSLISPLKDRLSQFDHMAQGAIVGKFSMLEVASALKEAKLCLELMSEVRKQVVSGLNQILNNNSG
jgi:flagellar hook-basal body complex protein FliE